MASQRSSLKGKRLEEFFEKARRRRPVMKWFINPPHNWNKRAFMLTSGNYEKVGADQLSTDQTPKEDEEFLLKPMNCPHQL